MVIKTVIRKIIIIILFVIAAAILIAGGFLAYLTVSEYKPADTEELKITGTARTTYAAGDSLSIMTWNIGYGSLGDNADFFMDGGEMVRSSDKKRTLDNMSAIITEIETTEPDIFLLQEVDRDSSRSYNVDETTLLRDSFYGYESTYGINYKAPFVPYPYPPLGKVDSGVMTFATAQADSAARIQLPVPFQWPVRTVNLKRCVAETHIPLYEAPSRDAADADAADPLGTTPEKKTGRDLVIFNLHLEAFDNGEGKIAQTQMLASLMNEEKAKGNYVIAGGDFNQVFSSENVDRYPVQPGKWQAGEIDVSSFGEGWQFLMDENTPSCRSLDQPYEGSDTENFQYYLIDGFIVSDNIKVEEMKTLDLHFKNSDHNPIVLQFRTKP